MSGLVSKEIHLKTNPKALPSLADFELVTVPVREALQDGEVLVRNRWMSVDPYIRLLLGAPGPRGIRAGNVMQGGAVGEIIESRSPELLRGDWVQSDTMGWREYAVENASKFRKIDINFGPPEAYLGVLGLTGITAYFGLMHAGEMKAGDTVFVSAAGGAVGQAVCQIAKAHGCYVVGSAGSEEKLRWLEQEAKVDRTINYKTCGDLTKTVGDAFPEGIDVYFSNVSGAHMEAALAHMKRFGRISFCGMVDAYNSGPVPGPSNLIMVMMKSLTIRGFNASNYHSQMETFYAEMGALIKAGKLKWQETVEHGIENAPDAFLSLFSGRNMGKMLVKLS